MTDTFTLLATPAGRISRQQWWTGVIAMIVIGIVVGILGVVIVLTFGQGNFAFGAWLFSVLNLAFLWPGYCLGIKRRHDRDNNGLDLVVFMGGGLLLSILQALGIGVELVDFSGAIVARPTPWLQIPGFLMSLLGLYLFVQLGFLRGTVGPNSYGPDPLDAAA